MDFAWSPEQEQIRAAIERVCAPFDADYWLRKDSEGGFPEDFHRALAASRLARHRDARGLRRRRAWASARRR